MGVCPLVRAAVGVAEAAEAVAEAAVGEGAVVLPARRRPSEVTTMPDAVLAGVGNATGSVAWGSRATRVTSRALRIW